MNKLSNSTQNKIGNTMRFIASRTNATRTKLIKLMYFMEEEMVKSYRTPFLGITYEVWQYGPVNKDVFVALANDTELYRDYIRDNGPDNPVKYVGKFEDDEFSDAEIEVMERVIKRLGTQSSRQLVAKSHREDTLWYKIAKERGVLKDLIEGEMTTTDYPIDFSELLSGNDKDFYNECLNIRHTANEARANAGI